MTEQEFLEGLAREEGRLLRIAVAILGQESDGWDALQEAVEQAWLHRRELRAGPAGFGPWMKRILVNRSLNLLRRRKVVSLSGPLDSLLDPAPLPDEMAERQSIWEAVGGLSEPLRQVVSLRYLGDLTLEEIARELDLPLGTVKSRLHRGLAQVRERWEGVREGRAAP